MSKKVTIMDYGLGNLFSVQHSFEHVGAEVEVTSDADKIKAADYLILPGVGAFKHGMEKLREAGLVETVLEYANSGKPLMGICLGMQMLFEASEENGEFEGLGLLKGRVQKIESPTDENLKVPHIGWSKLCKPESQDWSKTIFSNVSENDSFYFVHSYQGVCEDEANLLAYVDYQGVNVTAAVGAGNVYGCQFHPEKSSESGLNLCRNFLSL